MSHTAKVLVMGCGAVGTMCAYALQKSRLAAVTTVLRSNFEAVKSQGFHIQSVDHGEVLNWQPDNSVLTLAFNSLHKRDWQVGVERSVGDSTNHGPFDYLVVAMKSLPDVYSIPAIIQPAVTCHFTCLVLIQNGIDIEQPFVDAFPDNLILSGVTMVGCELNGRHVLHNDPDILYLGAFPSPNSSIPDREYALDKFSIMYESGGVKCVVVEDIAWHRWRKLVWNAPFNTICALTNVDSGTILDLRCANTLIRPAMDEIVALAAAAGHKLPNGIQEQMVYLTDKTVRLKPSMQIDAFRRRPMEIEVILGNPLRIARELGVNMPVLSIVYELLKTKQWASNQPSREQHLG